MRLIASSWLPPAKSTVAADYDLLFNFILFAGLIIFAIVVVTMVLFVVKYRRRGKAGKTSGKDHNLVLELLWSILPFLLTLIVFDWGFASYIRLNVAPANSLEIKVKAQKWSWVFEYPEGLTEINKLVVPVDQPVKLLMSSADVIHSFYVPWFRVKADVLPNRYSSLWFEAIDTGEYAIFCAEYCGKGHSEMLGIVEVVTDSAYAAYIESGTKLGEGLTLEEFGKQLFTSKACFTCHTIDGKNSQGPSFFMRFGKSIVMSDGSQIVVDENYIRESILSPGVRIVSGFQPIMPTFQGILKEREVDALVVYVKSLGKQ